MYTLIKLHEDCFILRSVNTIWQGTEDETKALLETIGYTKDFVRGALEALIDKTVDDNCLSCLHLPTI